MFGMGILRKTKVAAFEVSTCALGDTIETMVFNDVTGETDVWPEFTRRHKSAGDALAWHEHVVEQINEKFSLGKPDDVFYCPLCQPGKPCDKHART